MPTLEFKGKQHIYAHHLTVPDRPLEPDETRSCNPTDTDDNLIIHDEIRNYPKIAWQKLKENGGVAATAGEYVDRTDEANRPIPHICFKVPTGGGKTLLAAAALEHLPWQRGLVLWVVPSKAIYNQTKAALWDKRHPYRKMLNRASAGRVKMLEKEDTFNRDDIANYLCVMLLMLPATNRQRGREFLRMFRDSGRYPSFFPDIDNIFGNTELLNEYPDLECHTERGLIKQSLFNVFNWWHRVAARQRGEYYLQGWKRGRIYPDFVAMANEISGVTHVMIFDTKGEHLAGNLDTEYKRKVLETLEGAFNSAGQMVMRDGPTRQGIFQLVFSEQEFLEISARLDIEAYATRL